MIYSAVLLIGVQVWCLVVTSGSLNNQIIYLQTLQALDLIKHLRPELEVSLFKVNSK